MLCSLLGAGPFHLVSTRMTTAGRWSSRAESSPFRRRGRVVARSRRQTDAQFESPPPGLGGDLTRGKPAIEQRDSGDDSGTASASEDGVRTRSVEARDDARFEARRDDVSSVAFAGSFGAAATAPHADVPVRAGRARDRRRWRRRNRGRRWEPMAGDPLPVPPSTYAPSSGIGHSPSTTGVAGAGPDMVVAERRRRGRRAKGPWSPTRFYPEPDRRDLFRRDARRIARLGERSRGRTARR